MLKSAKRAPLVDNPRSPFVVWAILSTILHLCRALMGVTVGANEIMGFTTASCQLGTMVTEFETNGRAWAN